MPQLHPLNEYLAMVDTRWSLAVLAQLNSAAGGIFVNTRLRYNPSEGHDLFVVYNEVATCDKVDRTLARRSFFLKYNYTFNL